MLTRQQTPSSASHHSSRRSSTQQNNDMSLLTLEGSLQERRSFFSGTQVTDGESGLQIRGFLPQAHPLRRSVTDYQPSAPGYFNAFPNSSTSQLPGTLPPSYETAIRQDRTLPSARFKILPREEEGKESLPEYSCSLRREAVFLKKMELESPFDRADDRGWNKIYAVLDGTMLKLCKIKNAPFFSKTPAARVATCTLDLPAGVSAGHLIKTYTLQHAEVGVAADYKNKRRHYVIRLRVETEQFLLSCNAIETFLDWLEALSAAIDLAPPLDERSLPRYMTIPRRRRRDIVAEQERIMRTDFPHLLDGSARPAATSSDGGIASLNPAVPATRPVRSHSSPEMPRNSMGQESLDEADLREVMTASSIDPDSRRASDSLAPVIRPSTSPESSDQSQDENREGQVDEDGKWRPYHRWTHAHNIRYARRCMAVLCSDAPRQSDLVIKHGTRWKINWAEHRLEPLQEKEPRLPAYGENITILEVRGEALV